MLAEGRDEHCAGAVTSGVVLSIPGEELDGATVQRRSDAILAVIAAVSTLAFAWAGFQSGEWLRERFLLSDQSAAASEQALELSAEADRLEERDTILFVEWLIAVDTGQDDSAAIVFDLFREPVQDFVNSVDLNEQGIPSESIFESVNYDVAELRADAAELDQEARAKSEESRKASQTAARYGGLGVLFAVVLVASGVAARFMLSRIRRPIIFVCVGLMVVGGVGLVLTPFSLFS